MNKENLQYKIYPVNNSNKCLLIFTGIGGSLTGYGDKYVKIANYAMSDFDATVVVVSVESWTQFDTIFEHSIQIAERFFKNCGTASYDVFAMGISAGANIVLSKGYEFDCVKKVLGINPVIQMNYNKLSSGIEKFSQKIVIVMGTQDPSFKFLPFLENTNLQIEVVDGADHQFTQHFDLFVDLPRRYLFS